MSDRGSFESEEILDLLRTANGKDHKDVAVAFERYRDRLRRVVTVRLDWRLRGRCDPSDVVQETYLEATKRLGEYLDGPSIPFFVWLRLLATQKVVEFHRREFAQKRDAGRDAHFYPRDGSATSSIMLANAFVASQTSPSHVVTRKETRQRLVEALEHLAPEDRDVLMLRYFEQLTNVEAAQVLGVSEGAASQRHFRALRRLREVLQAYPDLQGALSLS